MEFLAEYGMFFAKTATVVFGVLLIFGNLLHFARDRDQPEKGELKIHKINDLLGEVKTQMNRATLSGKERRHATKQEKKATKEKREKADTKTCAELQSSSDSLRSRVFYLNFKGDLQARAANSLREEITAVLGVAQKGDEVVVNIESAGGVVHGYGFAASQLDRVRKAGIRLTALVDKVAASGGYMMACVAERIHAAPFAIIGSVGVLAQLPNFRRLLEKHQIDFELHTAGEHKRTLTLFGKNTASGREKFIEDLEEAHDLFKGFIAEHRPQLDLEAIATGEIWFGSKAKQMGLVDELETSDEYIYRKAQEQDVFEVRFEPKKTLQDRLSLSIENALTRAIAGLLERVKINRYIS
ncbi:MAG: protease SohB [Cellvibrionales bacterium]|nr:protease SohB [Cellvibrionales bacterium]